MRIPRVSKRVPTHGRAGTPRAWVFTAAPDLAHLFRAALATAQRRSSDPRAAVVIQSEALDAMLEHVLATWGAYKTLSAVVRDTRVRARRLALHGAGLLLVP